MVYSNIDIETLNLMMAKKSGFVTCGPNEALIVSGCCHRRPLMVPGGCVFVWPGIQKVQRISLNTMTLVIESPRVYTQQGVPISVTGIAQVKIQGQNADMLRSACEQFLGKSDEDIMFVARETLEGHQRAIMASMTVEEIYKNRKKFSKKVFEVASTDLVDMGLLVVSYTIKDISDDEGYLMALGQARTAEVKRDARIGEAQAKRDATIKEALANEEKQTAELVNKTEIAKAHRDFELKKASYDAEIYTKKADAELATALQTAITQQRIMEGKMQVKIIEKTQDIEIQKEEIQRKKKHLEATIRKAADAERYRMEKLAEANKQRIQMESEAEAKAIKLRGEAEAQVIDAKAKADAEILAQKADAYKNYENAAKIEMILNTLPRVAAEIAGPLAECNRIVMVSNSGEIGAGKITCEVLEIITKIHSSIATMIQSSSTTAAAVVQQSSASTASTVGIEKTNNHFAFRSQF
ncbi:flotillin-1-like protein [Euroglyphus maynei]|uniref:Flotillin-1-like protein n=1 Tax=Euroglyphus maynei TaxID=6958 RepID=A0A1Y3B506_EURMA|nr:flotillin-1-like protein [Euroglyphus maynei]